MMWEIFLWNCVCVSIYIYIYTRRFGFIWVCFIVQCHTNLSGLLNVKTILLKHKWSWYLVRRYIYIYIMNKYILDFIYLMPHEILCDLGFHVVLQTTIIRQITKENEEIEKIEKYSQKPSKLCIHLYMCLYVLVCICPCVCVCVFVWVIFAYYWMWTQKWCLVYVCVKIYTQSDKLEVVFRAEECSFSKLCYSRAESYNL